MNKKQTNKTKSSFDHKYILKRPDLSASEKLAYIIIDLEQPCDIDTICSLTNYSRAMVDFIIKSLLERQLIVKTTTTKDFFYPAFCFSPPQKTEAKKDKEKTVISEKDKDLYLFLSKLEEFYKQKGISHNISKRGKKIIGQAVGYLNSCWDTKEEHVELKSFYSKEEIYKSYIEFTFNNLEDKELKYIKRFIFAANKNTWRAHLKNSQIFFSPYLLRKSFSETEYYSVEKKEIPHDPKAKGFYTTVEKFLLNKWSTKTYPLCKQVLYALERVIVQHMYRKAPLDDLIKIHSEYLKEYKVAEVRNRLDDLVEYIKENKKRSDVCYGCLDNQKCGASGTIITKCTMKTTN